MATTYGIDRERAARAPTLSPDVNLRQAVLLTLTASVSYSVVLSPPGWLWFYNGGGHTAGDPLDITHPWRYPVFFYFRATAFVAALAVMLLHLLPAKLTISNTQRIKWYVGLLRDAMTLSLLAVSARQTYRGRVATFIYIFSLCIGVLLYIAIKLLVFWANIVEIALNSVQETPQKCLEFLLSKKTKYLLKVEQKDHHDQKIMSGQGSDDAYQMPKDLFVQDTLMASVTYQAGLNRWRRFCQLCLYGDRMRDKRNLVFFFCSTSAFVLSLAILPVVILSSVFSIQEIKYYCALQVGTTLDLLSLIGAYVARSSWQLSKSWSTSMLVGWVSLYVVIHVVVFLLQVFLACALWQQALREKMEHCSPGWLKKLFGLSIEEPVEDDDQEEEEEEAEEEEDAVIMAGKLEMIRKLLLLLATIAAVLAYHANASPLPDNLVSHRRLAFQYCNATVFITSLSIIAMLANMKFPEARCVRWQALRVCVILEVIGLMGAFAASCYVKISQLDVLVLVLAVLFCIANCTGM